MDEQHKPEEPAEQPTEQPVEQPAIREEVPQSVQQEPQQVAEPTQVYVPRKTEAAETKHGKLQKFKDFVTECKRVLRITKKPDRVEFTTIVKISGIGMAIVGVIGFLVHFVKELFF